MPLQGLSDIRFNINPAPSSDGEGEITYSNVENFKAQILNLNLLPIKVFKDDEIENIEEGKYSFKFKPPLGMAKFYVEASWKKDNGDDDGARDLYEVDLFGKITKIGGSKDDSFFTS